MKIIYTSVLVVIFIANSGCQSINSKEKPIYDDPYKQISSFPVTEEDFRLSRDEIENRFPDYKFYVNRENHPDDKKYLPYMCIPQSVIHSLWGTPDKKVTDRGMMYFSLILMLSPENRGLGLGFLAINSSLTFSYDIWYKGNYILTGAKSLKRGCKSQPSYIAIYMTPKEELE